MVKIAFGMYYLLDQIWLVMLPRYMEGTRQQVN